MKVVMEELAAKCSGNIMGSRINNNLNGNIFDELEVDSDVARLAKILERVAATNLSSIQKKLWDRNTKRALLFNNRVQEGDATWQVLVALSEKLDRSYRRSGVWNQ